jgi:hypothetical protein
MHAAVRTSLAAVGATLIVGAVIASEPSSAGSNPNSLAAWVLAALGLLCIALAMVLPKSNLLGKRSDHDKGGPGDIGGPNADGGDGE